MSEEIHMRKKAMMLLETEIFAIQKKYEFSGFTTKKHDNDCLTLADTQIERLLRETIEANFPNDAIIGEEENNKEGTSGFAWHLDPIDGTHAFTRGIKEYGTSIGLVKGTEIVMGIIFFSEDQKAYWAIAGEGSYCEDTKLHIKKTPLNQVVLATQATVSPVKIEKRNKFVNDVADIGGAVYMRYAAIWPFIAIARGNIDAAYLLGFGGSWDSCAGICIAKEAGAKISPDLTDLKTTGFLLIAEPSLYDVLEEKIR
jgi:myo-inositol-1(or 4)-monophosphatase